LNFCCNDNKCFKTYHGWNSGGVVSERELVGNDVPTSAILLKKCPVIFLLLVLRKSRFPAEQYKFYGFAGFTAKCKKNAVGGSKQERTLPFSRSSANVAGAC
jgi:hypothetical protein